MNDLFKNFYKLFLWKINIISISNRCSFFQFHKHFLALIFPFFSRRHIHRDIVTWAHFSCEIELQFIDIVRKVLLRLCLDRLDGLSESVLEVFTPFLDHGFRFMWIIHTIRRFFYMFLYFYLFFIFYQLLLDSCYECIDGLLIIKI